MIDRQIETMIDGYLDRYGVDMRQGEYCVQIENCWRRGGYRILLGGGGGKIKRKQNKRRRGREYRKKHVCMQHGTLIRW